MNLTSPDRRSCGIHCVYDGSRSSKAIESDGGSDDTGKVKFKKSRILQFVSNNRFVFEGAFRKKTNSSNDRLSRKSLILYHTICGCFCLLTNKILIFFNRCPRRSRARAWACRCVSRQVRRAHRVAFQSGRLRGRRPCKLLLQASQPGCRANPG